MKKAFKKKGFGWESLQIFGIARKKGWCTHFIFPNRDYGAFEADGKWTIMRRDARSFLDGSEREYFISGVVKGLVIKGDVVSEIYRLICVDLEIT